RQGRRSHRVEGLAKNCGKLPERNRERRRAKVERTVLELERGIDGAAASASRRKGERLAYGRAAANERTVGLRPAGKDHAICLQQSGYEVGRVSETGVFQGEQHRHGFARINSVVGWGTVFLDH